MITVSLDKRSERIVNDMLKNADKRVAQGEQLFLWELIGVLLREVQAASPKVPSGRRGRKYPYADRLRVGAVQGMDRLDAAVAIWLERRGQELKDEDLLSTALAIMPQSGAPPYVNVLAGVGMWPADLLPFRLAPKDAKVVARRVRTDEAQELRRVLWARRADIGSQLRQAGAPAFRWGKGAAAGQRVYVDVAWEILRNEFGWSDAPERAVWRPALKKVMAHVPRAARKLAEYLVTGKEGLFDVPGEDTVPWRKVRTGQEFQRVLMPFVKKR